MAKLKPEILILDVDGVLPGVRELCHRTIVETVRHFTGQQVCQRDIPRWKNRPSYSAAWKLTSDWMRAHYFHRIVALKDGAPTKPDSEGLRRIRKGRNPARALYRGDNVDDARAACRARVAFAGVLPRGGQAQLVRAAYLRKLGALPVLENLSEREELLE